MYSYFHDDLNKILFILDKEGETKFAVVLAKDDVGFLAPWLEADLEHGAEGGASDWGFLLYGMGSGVVRYNKKIEQMAHKDVKDFVKRWEGETQVQELLMQLKIASGRPLLSKEEKALAKPWFEEVLPSGNHRGKEVCSLFQGTILQYKQTSRQVYEGSPMDKLCSNY